MPHIPTTLFSPFGEICEPYSRISVAECSDTASPTAEDPFAPAQAAPSPCSGGAMSDMAWTSCTNLPTVIYSAAGSRESIVPIFEGAYDFRVFLCSLPTDQEHSASLEWFGRFAQEVIVRDCRRQPLKVNASANAC